MEERFPLRTDLEDQWLSKTTDETGLRGESREGLEEYQKAPEERKAEIVRGIYEARATEQVYSTSRDFNLRELEISFIAKHIVSGDILDIGCGNGYTILSLAKRMKAHFIGLDFSPKMLEGARILTERFSAELKSVPEFQQCDVRHLPFAENSFDCVISERCLQNLPSRKDQFQTMREVHRVLKHGGVYLMVEGTDDGLSRLNAVREQVGLDPIPPVSEENVSALRFREEEIKEFLRELFEIETVQFFGTYYLISRVLHPLLVQPEKPKFDAKINIIARKIAEVLPDIGELGHVMGYKLLAKK